jgi:hypothetical protein
MILVVVSAYSFLGNAALVGPSVYITIWAKEFNISPTKASGLISYSNLAFGFGRSSPIRLTRSMADADFHRFSSSCSIVSEDRQKTCNAIVTHMCKDIDSGSGDLAKFYSSLAD